MTMYTGILGFWPLLKWPIVLTKSSINATKSATASAVTC